MTAAINLNTHPINCSFINCSVINSRLQTGPTLSLHVISAHGALSADADSNSYSLHSLGVLSAHCRLLYHNFTSLLRRFTGPSLLLYIFSTLRSFIGPCRLLQLTAHVALPELADPLSRYYWTVDNANLLRFTRRSYHLD